MSIASITTHSVEIHQPRLEGTERMLNTTLSKDSHLGPHFRPPYPPPMFFRNSTFIYLLRRVSISPVRARKFLGVENSDFV